MARVAALDSPAIPRLFIGSSSDNGLPIVHGLQAELEARSICEVKRWDRAFEPSGYALDSLIREASEVDFAVLIATPDDSTTSRGVELSSARDNVILEFGLFVGALGRKRTYLLATDHDMKLPTDVHGITRLTYRRRADGDVRSGLNDATLAIQDQVRLLGPRRPPGVLLGVPDTLPSDLRSGSASILDRELDLVCRNAVAQGWVVKTNNETTLRLQDRRGHKLTLSKKSDPEHTRTDLRRFTAELRAAGLRVNNSVRRPA